jgi:hypothetical protein
MVASGRWKFLARSARGVWPIQSVMLNVPNSEKYPLSKIRTKWVGSSPRHSKRVPLAAREIPDVARIEVVRFGATLRIDHRRADSPETTYAHSAAAACQCSSHGTGRQPHGDAGDAFRDRQLRDGRLVRGVAAGFSTERRLKGELEGRQSVMREERIGNENSSTHRRSES